MCTNKIQHNEMCRMIFSLKFGRKTVKAAALVDIPPYSCSAKKTQRKIHMYNKDDDSSRVCASARIQEVRPAFTTIQCGREKVVGPSAFIHTNRIESQISFIVDRNRKTARRWSFNEMYRIVTIASARDSSGPATCAVYTLPRMIGRIAAPEVVIAICEKDSPFKRADPSRIRN